MVSGETTANDKLCEPVTCSGNTHLEYDSERGSFNLANNVQRLEMKANRLI